MDGLTMAMAAPSLSEDGQLKLNTVRRLQKVLQSEKKAYVKVLFGRCGVGLTLPDFTTIVQALAAEGWCSLELGRQGGVMVVLNEQVQATKIPRLKGASL